MKHFCSPPSEIVQWFKFSSRVRKPGESVATYIAELCLLSQYCNFGETLELMLSDGIVCGINDAQTQKCLLAVKNLKYVTVRKIALALETALQGCGRTNHKAPQCRFKDSVCSYCNKKGHLTRACCSKQSGLKGKLPTHLVAEEQEEHHDEYSLYTIQDARANNASTDPLHVTLKINGKPTVMEIDTGAAVSIMAETNFTR